MYWVCYPLAPLIRVYSAFKDIDKQCGYWLQQFSTSVFITLTWDAINTSGFARFDTFQGIRDFLTGDRSTEKIIDDGGICIVSTPIF